MAASREIEILSILIIIALVTTAFADGEYEGATTFTLEHAFQSGDDAVWTKRGSINIHSLKPGKTHIIQANSPDDDEISQLIEAVQSHGIYRIRIPTKADTGVSTSPHYVSSFTLACCFYESALSDDITINLDQSGEAIGVSIVTHPGICSGRQINDTDLLRYNTTVEIVQAVPGPTPDTQTYIDRAKKEEMDRAKGQQQDNRSFFAKYWMYIVPGVIIMILMNNMDPAAGAAVDSTAFRQR